MHSISCGMKRWYRAAMQVRAAISCLTAATTISRGPWVLLRLHTYTLTGLAIVRQGGPSSFEAPCRESLRLGQAQWNENEIAPGVWGSCSNTCWSSKWERVHLLWNLSELRVWPEKKFNHILGHTYIPIKSHFVFNILELAALYCHQVELGNLEKNFYSRKKFKFQNIGINKEFWLSIVFVSWL